MQIDDCELQGTAASISAQILARITPFAVGVRLLLHRYRARPGATMIVQGGEFVTARRCFPCNDVLRIGPANECVAREPINLAHVGICFRSQRDRAGRRQQDLVSLSR